MNRATVPPIRLIVFDMDGVLVDTTSCHRLAYDELWDHLGIQGPSYSAIAGRPTREVITDVTRRLHPSSRRIEEWTRTKQRRARSFILEHGAIFEDVPRYLALLSDRYSLALATAASRTTTELVLNRFALRRWFSAVLTAEDVADGKPSGDVYVRVMRNLSVPSSRTLVVEDSAQGLTAALAARAWALVVRTQVEARHEKFLGTFRDLEDMTQRLRLLP